MLPLEGIAAAGGWVVCVAVLVGLIQAFVRGALVSGHVFRREVKRGDRLEAANERLTRRIAVLEAASTEAATHG